jgi:V/A-type H+-transporting ATPase subunit D
MSPVTGRSGRLRLEHQLDTARRGADLLERKQRILSGELVRLRLVTTRTEHEWGVAAAEAARWSVRSQALDGAQRLADVVPQGRAMVEVSWHAAMGVLYPGDATVRHPPSRPTGGSSALVMAGRAHRAALEAAARHAAAERALAQVGQELESTRLRQQAIERRWVPRLSEQLRRLTMHLDELEREENLRMRWAAGAPRAGRPR